MTITLNKTNTRLLIVFFAIFLTVIGRLYSNALLLAALFLYAFSMVKGSDFENFEIGLLLIPCIRLFDPIGITFSINLLLFLPIIIHVLRRRRVQKAAFAHTAILCILEFIHCLTLNNMGNLASNISAISTLYFCEILLRKDEEYDPIRIFRWLSYGIMMSAAAYLLVLSTRSRGILYFINRGVRFEAFANDPNYYSMYICIALSCLFVSRSGNRLDVFIAVIDFVLGLLTSSKMSFAIMVFIVAVNGFRQLSSVDRKRRNTYRSVIVVAAVIAMLNLDRVTKVYENIVRRMGASGYVYSIADLTTGRSTLLLGYLKQLITNPLALVWGYGFQYVDHIGVATSAFRRSNVSHNTFLDVFLSWGLVGAAIVAYIIYYLIKKSFQHKKPGFFDKIPAFCLILCFFALSCLSAGMFWYIVAAALLAVKNAKSKTIPVSPANNTEVTPYES